MCFTCSFCLLQENVNLIRVGTWGVLFPNPSPDPPCLAFSTAPNKVPGTWWAAVSGMHYLQAPHRGKSASAVCWCCPLVALSPHRTWLSPVHPVSLLTSHLSSPGPASVKSGGGSKESLSPASLTTNKDNISMDYGLHPGKDTFRTDI